MLNGKHIDVMAGAAVFARRPNVVAAWFFGSAQDGNVHPGSDLDIAVLFQTRPQPDELIELSAALDKVYQAGEIDLVVLNDASHTLRGEAVAGQLIFAPGEAGRAEFEAARARRIGDTQAKAGQGLAAFSVCHTPEGQNQ